MDQGKGLTIPLTNIFLRSEGTCLLMRNLAGSLKVFCLFQIKQI